MTLQKLFFSLTVWVTEILNRKTKKVGHCDQYTFNFKQNLICCVLHSDQHWSGIKAEIDSRENISWWMCVCVRSHTPLPADRASILSFLALSSSGWHWFRLLLPFLLSSLTLSSHAVHKSLPANHLAEQTSAEGVLASRRCALFPSQAA